MNNMRAAYDEVYVYTMGRRGFILQHVVDAFTVQTASADTKPISIVFGLIGLYLHVEKQFPALSCKSCTWRSDEENESGRGCICRRIGAV